MKHYYIGVDLGGTNLKVSIFDECFSTLNEVRVATEVKYGSDSVLERIAASVKQLMTLQNVNREEISCIGIGVPGLLDIEKGIARFSPNFPKWENVNVVQELEAILQIPIFIDNDVRAHLYGEYYFGAGRGKKNIVLLALGTGLGSGVVVDGNILYGSTGSAGEVGHMNMYRSGRPCRCGSSGCLGRYVSAVGLVHTVRDKLAAGQDSILSEWVQNDIESITAKMVSEAFDLGDRLAIGAMRETGEILGFGIANVINLYNPELVIIGGGMANAGERLLQSTREIVRKHALKISQESCTIEVAGLGDSAGMIGAAKFAQMRLENN